MRQNAIAFGVCLTLLCVIGLVGLSACGGGGDRSSSGRGSEVIITPPAISAPRVEQTFTDIALTLGSDTQVRWESEDLASYFTDPHGGVLTYAVETSDAAVATVAESESVLTVTALAVGETTITVFATNAGGLVTQTFVVRVGAVVLDTTPIPDLPLDVSTVGTVDLSSYIIDPQGGALTYAVGSSEPAVAMVTESESVLTVTALAVGETTITVFATNAGGLTATQTFVVAVSGEGILPPDHPDTLGQAIPFAIGETVEGYIDSPGDADYFRFDVLEPGLYELSLESNIPGLEISLRDENGNILAADRTQSSVVLFAALQVGVNPYCRDLFDKSSMCVGCTRRTHGPS